MTKTLSERVRNFVDSRPGLDRGESEAERPEVCLSITSATNGKSAHSHLEPHEEPCKLSKISRCICDSLHRWLLNFAIN